MMRMFRRRRSVWAAIAAGVLAVPALFTGVAAAPAHQDGSDLLQPDLGPGSPLPPDPVDAAAGLALTGAVRIADLTPGAYHGLVLAAAHRHRLDPRLLAAVVSVETDWDPSAVGAYGELGLMQILPSTGLFLARMSGLDQYDLRDSATSLDLGARYLSVLLNRYGSEERALAAYNGGPRAVASAGTNAYARKVLALSTRPRPLYFMTPTTRAAS